MRSGGLRIRRPLRARRTAAEVIRRERHRLARIERAEAQQAEERKKFLREKGFVLPGEIILTDNL